VGALTANRQAAAVPEPAITAKVHQTLDVDGHLAAQVAFDLTGRVDVLADRQNLGLAVVSPMP
jgi:hypothetical protein